ncbi:MAG: hypothetical protein KGL12_00945, partial [Rhodospirillales bacterium]|nr:hypothetical protein [Rhodospirillales bacterium]
MNTIAALHAARFPAAHDRAAAARLVERFVALGPAEARLASRAQGAAMLAALGGNAPYLAELALRESATLCALARHGADRAEAQAMAALAHLR